MNHILRLPAFVFLRKNSKKSFFLLLLILAALLSAHGTNFLSGGPFAGGNGTSSDPYIIVTPAQLDAVRDQPDKCYRLGGNTSIRVCELGAYRSIFWYLRWEWSRDPEYDDYSQ